MTRPWLELTIYTKSVGRHGEPVYVDEAGQWTYPVSHVDGYAGDKRFSEAELAAEVFRQAAWIGATGRAHKTDEGRNIVFEAAFTFGPITRDEHEYLTVSQFAQRPHYDEVEQ